jgi:hypothetical protein
MALGTYQILLCYQTQGQLGIGQYGDPQCHWTVSIDTGLSRRVSITSTILLVIALLGVVLSTGDINTRGGTYTPEKEIDLLHSVCLSRSLRPSNCKRDSSTSSNQKTLSWQLALDWPVELTSSYALCHSVFRKSGRFVSLSSSYRTLSGYR